MNPCTLKLFQKQSARFVVNWVQPIFCGSIQFFKKTVTTTA